jgi:hypothetical protein
MLLATDAAKRKRKPRLSLNVRDPWPPLCRIGSCALLKCAASARMTERERDVAWKLEGLSHHAWQFGVVSGRALCALRGRWPCERHLSPRRIAREAGAGQRLDSGEDESRGKAGGLSTMMRSRSARASGRKCGSFSAKCTAPYGSATRISSASLRDTE